MQRWEINGWKHNDNVSYIDSRRIQIRTVEEFHWWYYVPIWVDKCPSCSPSPPNSYIPVPVFSCNYEVAYFCGIVKWKQVPPQLSLVSCWILSQTGLDLIKRVWTWSACRAILKRTVNKPVCMGGITLQGVSTLCPAKN